jgi:NAD(P)H dehydrogenase (quinone)
MTKIAVIYYSATGNVHALAEAVAEGALEAGAEVRLRRVAELTPSELIDSRPAWRAHADATADIEVATNDDLRWADGVAFGGPARVGSISAPLERFLDGAAPLWAAGELEDKVVTGFTSSNRYGGNESTLLALYHTLFHWGAIVVAPGSTDPQPAPDVLAAARDQGRRLAAVTQLLAAAERGELLAA